MNGKRAFGEFDIKEPAFELVPTVTIKDEPKNIDVFECLIELGDSGCWLWMGQHTERGTPIVSGTTTQEANHYVHRIVWSAVKNAPVVTSGRIVQKCEHRGCVNPEHFTIC